MMISTKGRYALRVMADLAQHREEGYVPLREIARRQEISEKYLEIILKALVRSRFLDGLRGKGGGYRLTREPEEYTVGSILRLTEGALAPVACLEPGAEACPRQEQCCTLPMWKKLDAIVNNFFEGITLAELAAEADGAGETEPARQKLRGPGKC